MSGYVSFWFVWGLWGFPSFHDSDLADFRNEICIPYLDDVLVFSTSFVKHVEDVRKVP